jgi:hypothetical protein
MTLLVLAISLLLCPGSAAASDSRCKQAHDPVLRGQKAPCDGVLIPTEVAVEASILKKASGAWDKIFEKQAELSERERQAMQQLLEEERKRVGAANQRADALESRLRDLSQEVSDRSSWYESPAFWAPVAALVGVVVTVIVYESR